MESKDPLTEKVIGCAIAVHRALGPGLLEPVYQRGLCVELGFQGCYVERERVFPVLYRGVKVGDYRPDIIVNNTLVVEVKAVSGPDRVFTAQMLTYLKVTGLHVGLLLNFSSAVLMDGIRRVVR